jgi:hypothetical protein
METAKRSRHHTLTVREQATVGLIDALVDRSFRDTPAGRVVVFSGDVRRRGYLVRSLAEEQKLRSFLKMFYFAHVYVLVFGPVLSQVCASVLINAFFDRPANHLLGATCIFLAIYATVVGLPYFFLWRAYKRAFGSFAAPADEVSLTGIRAAPGRQWILLAVVGFGLMILALIFLVFAVGPRGP